MRLPPLAFATAVALIAGCARERAAESPPEWLRLSPVMGESISDLIEDDRADLYVSQATIARGAGLDPRCPCLTDARGSGVHLAASASRLDLTLDQPLAEDRDPTELVVARWWVDDRPVHPRGHAEVDQTATLAWSSRHLRIELSDAMAAIDAAPGARVGVQVLVCPAGLRPPGESVEERAMPTLDGHPDRRPLLSQRVDFVVPPAAAR